MASSSLRPSRRETAEKEPEMLREDLDSMVRMWVNRDRVSKNRRLRQRVFNAIGQTELSHKQRTRRDEHLDEKSLFDPRRVLNLVSSSTHGLRSSPSIGSNTSFACSMPGALTVGKDVESDPCLR